MIWDAVPSALFLNAKKKAVMTMRCHYIAMHVEIFLGNFVVDVLCSL